MWWPHLVSQILVDMRSFRRAWGWVGQGPGWVRWAGLDTHMYILFSCMDML